MRNLSIGAKRSISAAQFASNEAGATSRLGARVGDARTLRRRFVLENQEERQYLDGFAQSHVVRETGAKPEAVQQVEPTNTCLLIRSQCCLERRSRLDAGESLRAAQAFESLCEPGPGAHRRPVGIRRVARLLLHRDAGHQPHGIGERQSAVGRCRFYLAKSVEELLELVSIHLDPASAKELQSVGPFEQGADFGCRESLLSERQLHLKVEQGVPAENGRDPSADGRSDLGARRSARAPRARGAHHNPSGLELGHIVQELECFGCGPSEGMVKLTGFHHSLEPCALSRSFLHRL